MSIASLHKKLLILLIAVGFPFVSILGISKINGLENSDGVEKLFLISGSPYDIQLPFSHHNLDNTVEPTILTFKTLNTMNIDRPHLYVPFYQTNLKIFANGVLAYDSEIDGKWRNATHLENVFVNLPKEKKIIITASINGNMTPSQSVSNFFVGPASKLKVFKTANEFYYYDLRTAFLGAQLCIIAMMLLASIPAGSIKPIITPLILLAFLCSVGLSSQANSFSTIQSFYPYLLSFTPLFALALLDFHSTIEKKKIELSKAYLATVIFCTCIILLSKTTNLFQIQLWNMSIIPPLMISVLIFTMTKSAIMFFKNGGTANALYLIVTFFALAAIIHDIAFLFGFSNNGIIISNIGTAFFFFMVATFYLVRLSTEKIELASHQSILENALRGLEDDLRKNFEENQILIREKVANQELSRINSELHDGIMTNISMIQALSEKASASRNLSINLLSKSIISEIRVLLMLRESKNTTLLMALSEIKRQLVDPAELMGVRFVWETKGLLYGPHLSRELILDIVRIIQEALQNALFRANSKFIIFKGELDIDGSIKLYLENREGKSFKKNSEKGFGIKNMFVRANKNNIELSLDGTSDGAILILRIPQ
jgi:signal transduction histidine kinase